MALIINDTFLLLHFWQEQLALDWNLKELA